MQIVESYTVDLAKINGKGDIKCPKCGTRISPDDETESVYTILEIVVNRENLDKIALKCNNCESQILLTGISCLEQCKIAIFPFSFCNRLRTSMDSLKSCKKAKTSVVRVPFGMTCMFQIKLDSVQPSQLYINSEKLRYVMRQLQSKPISIKPIPVKKLEDQIVFVDGHTRALAALLLGLSEISVYWEDEELDWDEYKVCVGWCKEENSHNIRFEKQGHIP